MLELTDKQRAAIERLQAKQADLSEEERRQFIQDIISVPKDELPDNHKPKKRAAKKSVKKAS